MLEGAGPDGKVRGGKDHLERHRMKALILNSGLGSRMGVPTSEHPKCMTEVPPRFAGQGNCELLFPLPKFYSNFFGLNRRNADSVGNRGRNPVRENI